METPKQPKKLRPALWFALGWVTGVSLCLFLAVGVSYYGILGTPITEPAQSDPAGTVVTDATQEAQVVATVTSSAATSLPAPSNTPKPTPTLPPGTGRIGERIEAEGRALTVVDAKIVPSLNGKSPHLGFVYLITEVLIESTNRVKVYYGPYLFKVKDADAFEYDHSYFAPEPSLQQGTLTEGDKVRGFITFEVKQTATELVLTYEPSILDGTQNPIRIALSQ